MNLFKGFLLCCVCTEKKSKQANNMSAKPRANANQLAKCRVKSKTYISVSFVQPCVLYFYAIINYNLRVYCLAHCTNADIISQLNSALKIPKLHFADLSRESRVPTDAIQSWMQPLENTAEHQCIFLFNKNGS